MSNRIRLLLRSSPSSSSPFLVRSLVRILLVVVCAILNHRNDGGTGNASFSYALTFPAVPTFRHRWNGPSPATATASTRLWSSGSTTAALEPAAPVDPDRVVVLDDAGAVGARIRALVEEAAARAIQERGHFAIAIPGGSILKMLVGSGGAGNAWTDRTTLAYVNHKCVPMDDGQLATHAKATKLFLKDWVGCHTIVMDGTADGPKEAAAYQSKLQSLSEDVLPRDPSTGFPIFDLALIGVGDDGHIGSLYPNREEVLVSDSEQGWVLSVPMKEPPSITLSLPAMRSARQVVVAACGVSDKYPRGKSEGMRRAIAATDETVRTFPAVGLRRVATWIVDRAAASKLGDAYH